MWVQDHLRGWMKPYCNVLKIITIIIRAIKLCFRAPSWSWTTAEAVPHRNRRSPFWRTTWISWQKFTNRSEINLSSGYEWNTSVRVSLRLESRSRNSVSSAARYAFNSLFQSRAGDFTTFTLHDFTDYYIGRATTEPHYNKISFMFS